MWISIHEFLVVEAYLTLVKNDESWVSSAAYLVLVLVIFVRDLLLSPTMLH